MPTPLPRRPTTRLASYIVYNFSRKSSRGSMSRLAKKGRKWRKKQGKEGWNTRRVPLPSWVTRNPSFSSSTNNFVSSIGPLIVLLANTPSSLPPHVIALRCYSYLLWVRVAVVDSSAEGDDRKFSDRFFVESGQYWSVCIVT